MNKRTKFSIRWGLDISKGILFLIALIVAIKVTFNPGNDPIEVILWRLLEVSILIIPTVIIASDIYGYINYEEIIEKDKKAMEDKNKGGPLG